MNSDAISTTSPSGLASLLRYALKAVFTAWLGLGPCSGHAAELVYITAKADLPFWDTVGKGVKSVADANGYTFSELDSRLSADTQLSNVR